MSSHGACCPRPVTLRVGRAIAYTERFANHTAVPYHRFEPSILNACMFVVPAHPLTSAEAPGNTFTASERHVTPATWLGYNKIQCLSPRRRLDGHTSASNTTVTVHVSNNGGGGGDSGLVGNQSL